jgi:type II secretory pathway predicted ATPase ExeA
MFSIDAVERIHATTRGVPRLINIVCERSLLVGYVEEVQVLKASDVDQSVADLNLKPIADGSYDQATGALGFEGTLLLRMAAQLDTVVKKLEDLENATAVIARRGAKEEPRLRQWLKSLRSNPLKQPESTHAHSFDELVDAPVSSLTGKPETNH